MSAALASSRDDTMATARSRTQGRALWVPVAYPILIGTCLYLLLFVASGASPYSALRMVLAALLISVAITVVANVVIRDRDRGALLATMIILGVYAGTDDVRMVAVLGLAIVVLGVEAVTSRRRAMRTPWPLITKVGNLIGVIALLAIGIKAAQDGTVEAVLYDLRAEGPALLRPSEQAAASTYDPTDPDIVVILLDGYARADKQLELFGHDDSAFIDGLASRGFQVADRSRSNYLITAASLSSFLNMRHLDQEHDLAALSASDLRHIRLARRLINENEVFRTLRERGYATTAISSGFEELALRQADRFIDTGQLNEIELLTFRHTGVGPLVTAVAPDIFADQQRARVDATFRVAAETAPGSSDRPELLFVHVPSPHAPVVFDADGGPVQARDLPSFYEDSAIGRGIDRDTYAKGYVGQVEYLNDRTLELVDEILASSDDPPVVLVMSDHGSASGFDFADSIGTDVDERSANLFAACTPGRTGVFEDDGTLVNVFGRLFQTYFGRPWRDLPDDVYGWKNPSIFDVEKIPRSRLDDDL
jgi:hypothetical protein